MTRLALVVALLGATAHAGESRKVWPSITGVTDPSVIEMHEPTDPGAVATITFQNERVHGASTEFHLTYSGVTVEIDFRYEANTRGDERVTVTPPEGYYAEPESITVPEHHSDQIHLYRVWLGG